MIYIDFSKNDFYTTEPAYQWDLNQTLEIHNAKCDVAPVIHFANRESGEAILVQSEMDEGVITCPVPNILLKDKYNIQAWLSSMADQAVTTEYRIEIPVYERVQPKDYYYTNNVPILTYEAIEADIQKYYAKAIEADKKTEAYTDEKVGEVKEDLEHEKQVRAADDDKIGSKVPFGFGVDINGNYGYIPTGSSNVVSFKSGTGDIDVKSGSVDSSHPMYYVTYGKSGTANLTLIIQKKAGKDFSYDAKVFKNDTQVWSKTYSGDSGTYYESLTVEVNDTDTIKVSSPTDSANLVILVFSYVNTGGSGNTGGEPVYNEVLKEVDEMRDLKKDIILVQENKPIEDLNKIWVHTTETEYVVPTEDEVDEIRTKTKNLWNGLFVNNLMDESREWNTSYPYLGGKDIPILPNTMYVFSINGRLSQMRYFITDENGERVVAINNANKITTPSSAKYITFRTVNQQLATDVCQLEEGNIPTDYESPFTANDTYSRLSVTELLKSKNNNLLDGSEYVNGKYLYYITGNEGDNVNYCYTKNYIVCGSGRNYIWEGSFACFYDINKRFIGGTNEKAFKTPSECVYMRVSCEISKRDTTVLREFTDDKVVIGYDGMTNSLSEGIKIARAFKITLVINGGTYYVNENTDKPEGIKVDGFDIIGIGMPTIIGEPNAFNVDFSPINLRPRENTVISGLKIIARNSRYCIHDECGGNITFDEFGGYKHVIKDCIITQETQPQPTFTYPRAIGIGLGNDGEIIIENCVVKSNVSDDISAHSGYQGQDTNSLVIVKDCVCLDGTISAGEGHVGENFKNTMVVSNCYVNATPFLSEAEYRNMELIQYNNHVSN